MPRNALFLSLPFASFSIRQLLLLSFSSFPFRAYTPQQKQFHSHSLSSLSFLFLTHSLSPFLSHVLAPLAHFSRFTKLRCERSRGLLVTETTATVEGEFTHGAASRRRWQWWRRWRRRRRGWWRRWHCPSSSRRTWWGTQKRNHHRLYHSPYISLRFRMPYDIPHTPLVFFWSAARPPIADGHKGSTVGSFNSDLRTVGCRS